MKSNVLKMELTAMLSGQPGAVFHNLGQLAWILDMHVNESVRSKKGV